MANDYGVYKDATVWVKSTNPLQFGSADQAQTWSETDAMAVASYLTITEGQEFRVGRPDDRHGH